MFGKQKPERFFNATKDLRINQELTVDKHQLDNRSCLAEDEQ